MQSYCTFDGNTILIVPFEHSVDY